MFHIYFTQSLPSITDWIQAIGVIVASIGLVVTLLLQRKTLKEQQKITLIEQQNFLNKYLPRLQLNLLGYNKKKQARNLVFEIVIIENHIQKIFFENYFPESHTITYPHIVRDVILPAGFKMRFTIDFVLDPVFEEIEEYTGDVIRMIYVDELGNSYYQNIIYKGGNNIFLEPAKRLKGKPF